MINKFNIDLLFEIIEFLPNHEIMEFIYINKNIHKILDTNKLIDFMENREHPLVINKLDNYCFICNQGLIFLNDDINSKYINCNHK